MNLNKLENLVVLLNKGDKNAFGIIYDKLFPGLYKYLRQFIDSREEAEDIVADSFLKLLSMRDSFTSIKKIISFLYVTSKHAGIDRKRQFKMQYGKREEMVLTLEKERDNLYIQDDITTSLLNRLYNEIERLPAKPREVMRLAYIEGLKNAEIARRLGASEKTIRNQKTSALNRLRLKIFKKIRF